MPDLAARRRFEDELRQTYNFAQLRTTVRALLKTELTDVVNTAAAYQTIVTEFVTYLEQVGSALDTFLNDLIIQTNSPSLRRAASDYKGLPPVTGDPYEELVIGRRPFVNRRVFRLNLKEFLGGGTLSFLFVRGPRSSGRSYLVRLIDHVLANEGISLVFVDLLRASLEDAVDQIATRMLLDRTQLRDPGAQASAQAKGVAWEIQRRGREFLPADRWCLVFDHYDRGEADPTLRQFVDTLAENLALPRVSGVWVVVLGHDGPLPAGTTDHSIEDSIDAIGKADIQQFVRRRFEALGRDASDEAVARTCADLFEGLTLPLDPLADPTGLVAMETRLKDLI